MLRSRLESRPLMNASQPPLRPSPQHTRRTRTVPALALSAAFLVTLAAVLVRPGAVVTMANQAMAHALSHSTGGAGAPSTALGTSLTSVDWRNFAYSSACYATHPQR